MATEENGTDVLVKELYKRMSDGPVDYDALNRQLPNAISIRLPFLPDSPTLPPLTLASLLKLVHSALLIVLVLVVARSFAL